MSTTTNPTTPTIAAKLFAWILSPAVWIPSAVMIVGTVVFSFTDLDVALMRPFFSEHATGQSAFAHFPLGAQPPWNLIRDWGILPAWILGAGGLFVWIASFAWGKLKPWRDPGLFLALALVVGPGLMVNSVLKPTWNRPRPKATAPFGGPREFLPVWQPGVGGDHFSFPSGHAAAGFFLMTPAFFLYRRRPGLALAFLLLGIAAGLTIGVARMAAGCHFPSDVLWSGGVVYFTGLILAVPFRFGLREGDRSMFSA